MVSEEEVKIDEIVSNIKMTVDDRVYTEMFLVIRGDAITTQELKGGI